MSLVRWQLYDPASAATPYVYTFEVNPSSGGSPQQARPIVEKQTLAPGGKRILFEGAPEPDKFEWEGVLRSKEQHEMLVSWFTKRHQIVLIDDLGREFSIYITSYEPSRQRGSRRAQWKMEYKVTAIKLDWVSDPSATLYYYPDSEPPPPVPTQPAPSPIIGPGAPYDLPDIFNPQPGPVLPGPGGNPLEVRLTAGIEVTGGGGYCRPVAELVVKVIKDFPTWDDDKYYHLREQIQVPGNAWAYQTPNYYFQQDPDNGTTQIPLNRVACIWTTGGAGTVTVNGASANISAGASYLSLEASLASLSTVGQGNVECAGSWNNGYSVKFRGALANQDMNISVAGSGWKIRTFKLWPNFAIHPAVQSGISYTDTLSNLQALANRTGIQWEQTVAIFNYLVPYFPRMTVCVMHEMVGSNFGYYNVQKAGPQGPALYAQAYRNFVDYCRQVKQARNPSATFWFDYNVWLTSNTSESEHALWESSYPGNSYVDIISHDPYSGGRSTSARDGLISRCYDWLTPFIISKNKFSAIQEFATGNAYNSDYGDNRYEWGNALYQWWIDECNAGRGKYVCYFDAPGGAGDDFTFDGRKYGVPNPVSRALFLSTFG